MYMLKKMIEKWFRLFIGRMLAGKNDVAETMSEKISSKQLTTSLKKDGSMQKGTGMMVCMEQFLEEQYDFRFNMLTEETEYRKRNVPSVGFHPVGQRELNSFCIEARKNGIDCWDRDVSRYVLSDSISEYHPFRLFMEELPEWDGTDRVIPLARRCG